jgi:hypothetical protein
MTEHIKGITLIKENWETWDKFIELVKQMDLLIQVSYTESFNMITADGISVGVPSVVSPVIRWAPNSWKADADDALDVSKVGIKLLTTNQHHIGSDTLHKSNERNLKYWLNFLRN